MRNFWFRLRTTILHKQGHGECTMGVDYRHSSVIKPVDVVRDLTIRQHMNKVVCACFYQLRRLKHVRRLLGQQTAANLVSASFIFSRLDYCNLLLAGLSTTPTTCPERRCKTCHQHWTTRPRDSGAHQSALVADVLPHSRQTMCAQAPCARRAQSSLKHLLKTHLFSLAYAS